MAENLALGTGKRKTSIAKVFLRSGTGQIEINGRKPEEYFGSEVLALRIKKPLEVTSSHDKYDILIRVIGGGISSQAGACRHGIARVLVAYDEANRPSLKANGFLTRDSRMVERKKYGRRGARRRFQFSKR
ncbi:MAG: 30S ribosomal protein S9 [Spirochaetales bacterium]|nr:30S ribosomal protein S9 [Spirochaetales bacterium]